MTDRDWPKRPALARRCAGSNAAQYDRDHPDFADVDFHDPSNPVGVRQAVEQHIHPQSANERSEFQRQSPIATRAEIEAFRDAIDTKYADAWWD